MRGRQPSVRSFSSLNIQFTLASSRCVSRTVHIHCRPSAPMFLRSIRAAGTCRLGVFTHPTRTFNAVIKQEVVEDPAPSSRTLYSTGHQLARYNLIPLVIPLSVRGSEVNFRRWILARLLQAAPKSPSASSLGHDRSGSGRTSQPPFFNILFLPHLSTTHSAIEFISGELTTLLARRPFDLFFY